MTERAVNFVMLKPLGTKEPLRTEVLTILKSISDIPVAKRQIITLEQARELYAPSGHDNDGHKLPHYDAIVNYLTGKLIEAMIVVGNMDSNDFIQQIDEAIGPWRPEETKEGQIRNLVVKKNIPYVFPVDTPKGSNKQAYDNLIHSSDSYQSALREMAIIFTPEEIKQILEVTDH